MLAGRTLRLLFAGGCLCALLAAPVPGASRPAVTGTGGAVSSDEWQATEVGLEILRSGGNAADAAVATALAMAVVAPEAGNLGGGGFAVSRFPGADEAVRYLDFREVAPSAATRDMYLGPDGEPVRELSWTGPLAAGVPGSPDGLYALHRELGSMPWPAVVAPAIRLAERGFVVSRRTHDSLSRRAGRLARFPESASAWLGSDGSPPAAGSTVRRPALAETLRLYADEGPAALTEGPVAQRIVATSERHGGILSLADLASYEPAWREPVRFEAFGWELASADLPSSGGILLGASAWMLERLDVASTEPLGADRVHLLVEAWRLAYADRYLLGDPSTTRATAADLLDPSWLAKRLETLRPQRAMDSSRVKPWSEPVDTTQISVVDGNGNAVSLTTTLNGLFGCGLWVPGFGFLNNEMDDFAAKAGAANEYGLVQGEANVVRPGRRMLSSMSPTVAWRSVGAGEEILALGGRGGSRIPTGVLQVFLALAVDGAGLQEALDHPRVHHQWLPDRIDFEPLALSPETRAELVRRGHEIGVRRSVAQVQVVRRLADGAVEAAADPRGGGGHGGVVDAVR